MEEETKRLVNGAGLVAGVIGGTMILMASDGWYRMGGLLLMGVSAYGVLLKKA